MAYRVEVTAAADKDLDRLPKKLFERVDAHILALAVARFKPTCGRWNA